MGPSEIRQAIEKTGCSIEIEEAGRVYQIILDSPAGKVFKASGCHVDCSLHGNGFRRGTIDWKQTYADAMEVIGNGFYDCDDPECDHCHPVE